MCAEFGLATPDWAKPSGSGGIEVAAIRNDALHEALYVDARLGFAVHSGGSFGNLPLEMVALGHCQTNWIGPVEPAIEAF